MKAKFFLRCCLLGCLVLSVNIGKAQYAAIPDSSFRQALIRLGYGSCFDGTQMMIDTTCSAILSTDTLDVSVSDILDLTGIRYFKHLKYLNCFHNPFTFLPELPDSLEFLTCQECKLISLPSLPSSLRYLNCGDNFILSLPSLPDSLYFLSCETNQLSNVPILPTALTYFSCNGNMIGSLPALPASLMYIDCGANVLDSLPPLPAGLTQLLCGINHLVSIPFLPGALTRLYCNDNRLNTLPVLPNGLTRLYCYNNFLHLLPALPSGLRNIDCSYNQLSSLPTLPDTIHSLSCRVNMSLHCLPELKYISYLVFDSTIISCIPDYPQGNITSTPALNTIPLCTAGNLNGCQSFATGINAFNSDDILSVYPNPAYDLISIKLVGQDYPLSYSLTDMEGRELMTGSVSSSSNNINISALNFGIYELHIQGAHLFKIVKE